MKKFMVKLFTAATLLTVANFILDVFGSIQQAGACSIFAGEIEMPKALIK